MAKIQNIFFEWLILVIFVKLCNAEVYKQYRTQSNLYKFEQMKSELFTKNANEEFRNQKLSPNDAKCLTEFNTIRNDLDVAHLWAVKCNCLIFNIFSF